MQLNNEEIRRYSRQLILPEVDLAAQKRLKSGGGQAEHCRLN